MRVVVDTNVFVPVRRPAGYLRGNKVIEDTHHFGWRSGRVLRLDNLESVMVLGEQTEVATALATVIELAETMIRQEGNKTC